MAVPMYPGAPAPSTRPTTVTVAGYLLFAAAALSLIDSILGLTTVSTTADVYRNAYAGTEDQGLETVLVGATVVGVVLSILSAVGLVVLGIFNNRGRQGARVTTWVIGGLLFCCGGISLLGTAATSALESSTATGGPSNRQVEAQLDAALPSWYSPTSTTLSVLMLVAIVGALVLLALPASNAYFRAVRAARKGGGWDPSVPYPVYPGQQQPYPVYPGQSQPGQAYPGQPYPGQPGQPQPGQPYSGQAHPGQQWQPDQSQSGRPFPGQSQPGYSHPGQSFPGQSQSEQSYPGQSQSGQSYSGQPEPGQAFPGQSGPAAGGESPSGQQFGGPTPAGQPHTGSIPPTDPWGRPDDHDDRPKPPTDPTAQS